MACIRSRIVAAKRSISRPARSPCRSTSTRPRIERASGVENTARFAGRPRHRPPGRVCIPDDRTRGFHWRARVRDETSGESFAPDERKALAAVANALGTTRESLASNDAAVLEPLRMAITEALAEMRDSIVKELRAMPIVD